MNALGYLYVEALVAYLFIPPIIVVWLIALRCDARMAALSKRCVLAALCCGYASSLTTLALIYSHACNPTSVWQGKTILPTLIAPVLLILALAWFGSKAVRVSLSKPMFVVPCIFAHVHFCLLYLWWLTSSTPFEMVLWYHTGHKVVPM